jgi:hypothetical protein
VSTTEELLQRKSSGSGLENLYYGRRGSADYATSLYQPKLSLTSPTSGGSSVGTMKPSVITYAITHSVEAEAGTYEASHAIGTGGSFPGFNAAWARS